MKKIVIVQRRLTHYRVPFFNALRSELKARGIELALLAGRGTPVEVAKRDEGYLNWATTIPTRYWAAGQICWQPFGKYLSDADVVIVTHENKLIYNHILLCRRRSYQLAFWGHGANLQSESPTGAKERFKRWTARQVDWWFAYTDLSRSLVTGAGFPAERITVVNNTIDAVQLRANLSKVTEGQISELRQKLALEDGPVGVFIGSLYADKKLDFLFLAAEQIKHAVPEFSLLLIGDGPERGKVLSWCASRPWARWVGAKIGFEKALHLRASSVMLNPGLVGLGVLDSFVAGVPMVTTDCGIHSPEIAYLQSGVNGLIAEYDVPQYSLAVISLLADGERLNAFRRSCLASGEDLTIEKMAKRFALGVEQCLAGGAATLQPRRCAAKQ